MLSRFQGSLLGVLLGDCLGAPFEGSQFISKGYLAKHFGELRNPNMKLPFKPYTDDTAMTKSFAISLIQNGGELNPTDLAKRFVGEYIKEPKRGYGSNVPGVFEELRLSGFEDPFGPATRQFGGQGSYGNGAAMRVAPAALLLHYNTDKLIQLATDSSRITHSNKLGIQGAILHALAIQEALHLPEKTDNLDVMAFTDVLIQKMSKVEELAKGKEKKDPLLPDLSKVPPGTSYAQKLKTVKDFLAREKLPEREEVDERLGVHVSAPRSVPTAIYTFLAAQKEVPEIEADCIFQRTIQYAISLGGDTDTIASMAGAIAGAQVGVKGIPSQLLSRVEAPDQVVKWAEDLFKISEEKRGKEAQEANVRQ